MRAFVLMTNHYHALVETPLPTLSRGMQMLDGDYASMFNIRRRRKGHLFQGRFKGHLIEQEGYLLEVARYIVLNPVRAHMVRARRVPVEQLPRDAPRRGFGPPWSRTLSTHVGDDHLLGMGDEQIVKPLGLCPFLKGHVNPGTRTPHELQDRPGLSVGTVARMTTEPLWSRTLATVVA